MASLMSDQKKRALEALERRFAFDKAKITQQEEDLKHKKWKRNPNQGREVPVSRDTSGATQVRISTPLKIDPYSSPNPPAKKRYEVSVGCTPTRTPKRVASGASGEDDHPAYSEISHIVDENLVGTSTMAASKADSVKKIVLDILQHGDKGHKYNMGKVESKYNENILLDNFVGKDNSLMDARLKALQSHSKRSKKHMSMRQHRMCGSLTFPKEFHNFNLFKPMHEMWKEYIIKILKDNKSEKQLAQILLLADLHGAFLRVIECKTIAFKGIGGIMIRETAETFGLITEDSRFRVVPKQGSVFIFQAGCWKITLHGDKLSMRNSTT